MSFPTLPQAFQLYDRLITTCRSKEPQYPLMALDLHLLAVAANAMLIASKIPLLDPQKAFVLGLLHDYGEIDSRGHPEAFHGTCGYDKMRELGFTEVAQICLTHSFPNPAFIPEDYAYPQVEMQRARNIVKEINYTNYDRLIQYCDALVNIYETVPLKQRMIFIKNKYKVSPSAIRRKYKEVLRLKKYFDRLCGQDTYQLLGINNESGTKL